MKSIYFWHKYLTLIIIIIIWWDCETFLGLQLYPSLLWDGHGHDNSIYLFLSPIIALCLNTIHCNTCIQHATKPYKLYVNINQRRNIDPKCKGKSFTIYPGGVYPAKTALARRWLCTEARSPCIVVCYCLPPLRYKGVSRCFVYSQLFDFFSVCRTVFRRS